MSKANRRHKGMVTVEGVTYRIERIEPRTYAVVRLNDDKDVGTFKTGRSIQVSPGGIEVELLEMVARLAVKTAKTSWVSHPKPSPPPSPNEETSEKAPVSSRRGLAPA